MAMWRKLRRLFERDSMANTHPRKRDDELLTVQRMERILRDTEVKSKQFHVKYVGCSRVVGPKLSQESGESVAEHILRSGPKKNKRRVTITFTAEQCYITDMIYRCCLAQFHMNEFVDFFTHSVQCNLFGFVIKAIDTNGYLLFLYKGSVKNYDFENTEILREYEKMYEEYLKIKSKCERNQALQQEKYDEPLGDDVPYYEKIKQTPPEGTTTVLNSTLYTKIEKPEKLHLSLSETERNAGRCVCGRSRRKQAAGRGTDPRRDGDYICTCRKKDAKRQLRRPILNQLLEHVSSDEDGSMSSLMPEDSDSKSKLPLPRSILLPFDREIPSTSSGQGPPLILSSTLKPRLSRSKKVSWAPKLAYNSSKSVSRLLASSSSSSCVHKAIQNHCATCNFSSFSPTFPTNENLRQVSSYPHLKPRVPRVLFDSPSLQNLTSISLSESHLLYTFRDQTFQTFSYHLFMRHGLSLPFSCANQVLSMSEQDSKNRNLTPVPLKSTSSCPSLFCNIRHVSYTSITPASVRRVISFMQNVTIFPSSDGNEALSMSTCTASNCSRQMLSFPSSVCREMLSSLPEVKSTHTCKSGSSHLKKISSCPYFTSTPSDTNQVVSAPTCPFSSSAKTHICSSSPSMAKCVSCPFFVHKALLSFASANRVSSISHRFCPFHFPCFSSPALTMQKTSSPILTRVSIVYSLHRVLTSASLGPIISATAPFNNALSLRPSNTAAQSRTNVNRSHPQNAPFTQTAAAIFPCTSQNEIHNYSASTSGPYGRATLEHSSAAVHQHLSTDTTAGENRVHKRRRRSQRIHENILKIVQKLERKSARRRARYLSGKN